MHTAAKSNRFNEVFRKTNHSEQFLGLEDIRKICTLVIITVFSILDLGLMVI